MGLFGNYNKEGRGVYENTLNKKGLALFIDILKNRFSVLMYAGVICVLFGLPVFAIYMFLIAPQFTEVFFVIGANADTELQKLFADFLVAGVLYNFCGAGPVSAAYAYISRSVTRWEHVWIWSDLFKKMKENLKQGILYMLTDMIVLFVMGCALRFYTSATSTLYVVLYFIVIDFFVVYLMAHIFTYQIMVTYKCRLIDIVTNALIFTGAKLPMCILLLALTGVLCVLLFGYLGVWGMILYVVIATIFTRYPLEFYASRVIEKHMRKKHTDYLPKSAKF